MSMSMSMSMSKSRNRSRRSRRSRSRRRPALSNPDSDRKLKEEYSGIKICLSWPRFEG